MEKVYYGCSSVRNEIPEAGERERTCRARAWARGGLVLRSLGRGPEQHVCKCELRAHPCICPGRQLGLGQVRCALCS